MRPGREGVPLDVRGGISFTFTAFGGWAVVNGVNAMNYVNETNESEPGERIRAPPIIEQTPGPDFVLNSATRMGYTDAQFARHRHGLALPLLPSEWN
jgi:hypothetical protein